MADFTDVLAHELVERERERSQLAGVLDRACTGRGGVAVIEAVAGAGKTSLLDLAQQLAHERGVCVLRARGAEISRDTPLAVLRGLFERRLRQLAPLELGAVMSGPAAELAGALGLADPWPLNNRVLQHASYWLVANLADRAPIALLVDDLQWADTASVRALASVAARLDDLNVALIVTHRPADEDLLASDPGGLLLGAVVRLHPGPLSQAGVASVLRSQLGADAVEDSIAKLGLTATGGNPFLVRQLAAALADGGAPVDARQLADVSGAVSASLTSVLRMRVGRLGRDAVALAHAVAILGDDCDIAEACALAGISRDSGFRAAASLAQTAVFASDRVIGFAHPLVRSAVSGDLPAAERARLQERAAMVLLDAGADASRVAAHLLQSAPASRPRAVSALRAGAGAAAAAATPGRAAVLLRRAIAEMPGRPPSDGLLDAVIAAELTAGESPSAIAHIRERLARPVGPEHQSELIRSLGRMVMQTDGVQAGIAVLDDQVAQLDGESRLIVEAEQAWMISLHPPAAARLQPLIDAYAGLPGDTAGQRAMLAMVGLAMSLDGRRPASVVTPIVARAFGDGALLGDQRQDSSAHSIASYALLITEQFELAEREMSRAADGARRTGSTGLGIALLVRGMARLNLGRIADAEADGLATLEFGAVFPGSLNALVAAAATGLVVDARAERGDDEGAMGALVDQGLIGDLGSDPGLRALAPRARAHLAGGRADAALADAERAGAAYQKHQDVMNHSSILKSQAQLALGNRTAALDAATAQLRRARTWGTPSVVATALRITALASAGQAGVAMLLEAERVLDDSPARLEKARCLLALGMLYRRVGKRTAALDALRRGCDLAHSLGARRIAELARAEMRVLGARPRRLALSGTESLTASQRRVAQLAAGGRTNREIASELYLSSKTVEGHLSETYSKLGINSRRELAAIITDTPSDPGSV